jgi:PAS domain S-box-containing protein
VHESAVAPALRGMWALGFVIIAIVALAAVPAYYGQRVADLQSRITNVLEPAARLSSSLRLLKARQFARMEGYIATQERLTSTGGDPGPTAYSFRNPYNAAIAEEDDVLSRLSALAPSLNRAVAERIARVSLESTDWRLVNERIFDSGVNPGARNRVLAGYNDLQRVTEDLDRAIQAEVDAGRREVQTELRRQSGVTIGLAVLALLSALIVGRVAYRYRSLMIEREARRRDAVRARREIDALLEATGDGVLGIDLDGRCISLNRAGAQLLGYTEREIVDRDVHDTLFHTRPDGRPARREDSRLLESIADGRVLESGDGALMWRRRRVAFPARWSLRPMIDGGELRGAVLTFTDMTEIFEKEEALRRAIRHREDVVSIVSHDLRNPLGVALAAADLLLDLPLDEKQRRRQAEIIRRSGKRMQSLIEDLLDVSRIEAGVLVVRPSQEDLAQILEEARALCEDQANLRGIRLELEPGLDDPKARVDRDRILQALTNLLDNAIRVTPEGGCVRLSARAEGDHVLLTVADTGPGVPPEMLGRLFDRFTMTDDDQGGSTGLGLTIVRGVAVAHDGEVRVQSEPGRGAAFTLHLPKRGPAVGEGKGAGKGKAADAASA